MLPSETIYPNADANLAKLLDRVGSDRIVVIKHRDGRNIASSQKMNLNSNAAGEMVARLASRGVPPKSRFAGDAISGVISPLSSLQVRGK
jgi:hypothetical protein